jgi:hypothetical protein
MSLEFLPPFEIESQRSAWFKNHAKPRMTFEKFIRLNDEAFNLFPRTEAEH